MNLALLVYDVTLTGGAERVALNLADEFAKKFNVTLISVFNSKIFFGDTYRNVCISSEQGSITLNFSKYSEILKNELLKNNIDILIAITAGVVTLAVNAAKNTKARVIYSEHSNLDNKMYGKKHELRQYIGAVKSDLVVTLTERDRMNFCRKFKLNPDKTAAIPNWYAANNKTVVYSAESKAIISVGRLEKVKGYDMLVKVAANVFKSENSDWHWDVYGDGSLKNEIKENIDKHNLNDHISLKGNVSNVCELYQKYSFMVMTSLYEGFPMSLLEAQSAGLPIISFDCPTGPSEIISDDINGILVPAYDIEKMGSSINELIKNGEKRKYFSENAGINLHQYSKDKVLKKWYALFEKLMKQPVQ
ncbi:MAG: glycosyltransferase family 4 protein [Eubacterium sp.]|nr:glycosyltransferase family 4 protein [Eubacterium sp.]